MIQSGVKVNWCKLLGAPVDNYAKDGKEWTVDLIFEDEALVGVREAGFATEAYLKTLKDGTENVFKYRRNAVRKDGEPAKPIEVVDKYGKPWDSNILIGNGSTVTIKYFLTTMESGKNEGKQKLVLTGVKVDDLVEYAAEDNFQFEEDPAETW